MILFLSMFCAGSAFAAEKSYKITIDGESKEPAVTGYQKGDKIMVPVRATAEAMGYSVTWIPERKALLISTGTQEAVVTAGARKIHVDGSIDGIDLTTDAVLGEAVEVKNKRYYIPADFFTAFLRETVLYGDTLDIARQQACLCSDTSRNTPD